MNNQYLFNIKYYDSLYYDNINTDENIKKVNKEIINYKLSKEEVGDICKGLDHLDQFRSFRLKTCYPGLLIGVGNPHASGNNSEEIKLGFTLDYTTGLPYIPGSTVKGVIRSIFKKYDEKGKEETVEHFNSRIEAYKVRLEYLKEAVLNIIPNSQKESVFDGKEKDIIQRLEKEIFGDKESGKGDIFFDAFPVCGGENDIIFALDSITPHEQLKNPVPIRMLKILPDVEFQFGFILKDSQIITGLTAENKEKLFKKILCDFGIGAKTNVGFGSLCSENRHEDSGKCRRCGRAIDEKQNGKYCEECAHLRPKCTCKKKKVEWDSSINDWESFA